MRWGRPGGLDLSAVVGVFAVAMLPRLWLLVHLDRRDVGEGYDPATYYTAASALLHGRMPYHGDFTFLHPPGIILAGLPAALLGRLTDAHTGFLAANLTGCLLGSLTAAGVTAVAGQWGCSRWAAVLGGLFLAGWNTTVVAESVFRLEPLGDAALVGALLALGAGTTVSRRRLVVAGVALGLLVSVKVWWWPVALLAVALTALRVRRWNVVVVPGATAALTALLVNLPFLVVGRGRMFHAIVTVQLGRPAEQGTPTGLRERMPAFVRLDQLTGAATAAARFLTPAQVYDNPHVHVVTALVCLVFGATAVLALRTPLGRFSLPLLAVQLAVLLTAPTYFSFYGDFVGVSAALTLAAGAAAWPMAGRWLVPVLPVLAVAFFVLGVTDPRLPPGQPTLPDAARLRAAVGDARCVVADSPRLLIALDAVDRSLSPGCRNWVDIQGVGHGGGPDPRALVTGRRATPEWRREMLRYLRSGDVVVLSDTNIAHFIGTSSMAELVRGRRATRSGGVTVYGPELVR